MHITESVDAWIPQSCANSYAQLLQRNFDGMFSTLSKLGYWAIITGTLKSQMSQ